MEHLVMAYQILAAIGGLFIIVFGALLFLPGLFFMIFKRNARAFIPTFLGAIAILFEIFLHFQIVNFIIAVLCIIVFIGIIFSPAISDY